MDDTPISYEEFGTSFVHRVVTPERVAAAITAVVGDHVVVGPLSAGPGDAARATMTATLADVNVTPRRFGAGSLRFDAVLRLPCQLEVKAPAIKKAYRGELTIPLRLEVRTAAPVRLLIDVTPPAKDDIGVHLDAGSRSGRLIQVVGNIDAEVQARTAALVRERIDAPEAQRHRQIDILSMVDDVWRP